MSANLLTVSPSPHVHTELTVPQIMRGVIIAMAPALIFSIYNFGLGALYVSFFSVFFCVFIEYGISKYLLKRVSSITDGSAIITGLLLAFNVPSNLPLLIIFIGSAVSIGIGKMSFGGLGNNPFNPALVGRVFLLLSFPVQMTSWPVRGAALSFDAVTSATPLGLLKEGVKAGSSAEVLMKDFPSYSDLFFGMQSGSLGEVSAFALILGLIYMMYRKIITWHIPISMLLTISVLTGVFWLLDPTKYVSPIFHLLTGGIMLGAIFMATDYVTSPFTHRGMILFGVGIGLLTVIIRLFGSYPEGVSFAILIMNAFVPMINKYVKEPRYGARKKPTN